MSINHIKTPLGRSLNEFGQRKAQSAIQLAGKALPCQVEAVSGTLVTVSFRTTGFTLPQITVPTGISTYVRLPIQVGDTGVVFPADTRIGGISGQGGPATADFFSPGNLSALTFFPISATAFPTVDPNAVTITGPNGAVMQDAGKACVWTLTPSGVVLTIGGVTFTFSATGLLVSGGDVQADSISLKTHLTSGVTPGGGVSSVPVP